MEVLLPRPECSETRAPENRLLIALCNALIGGVVDSDLGLGNDRLIP